MQKMLDTQMPRSQGAPITYSEMPIAPIGRMLCVCCDKPEPPHVRLAMALYGPPHKDGLNLIQAELRVLAAERYD